VFLSSSETIFLERIGSVGEGDVTHTERGRVGESSRLAGSDLGHRQLGVTEIKRSPKQVKVEFWNLEGNLSPLPPLNKQTNKLQPDAVLMTTGLPIIFPQKQ
jgi:hypothetical protein